MNTTCMSNKGLFVTASVAALCLLAVLPARLNAQAPQYSVTVLGGLGGNYTSAIGVNNSGKVFGVSYYPGNSTQYAVVWNGTTPTALGDFGGGSAPYGINASGQIVGVSSGDAVEWNGTTPTIITSSTSISNAGARGINDAGVVVGAIAYPPTAIVPAVWSGPSLTVPVSLGGSLAVVRAINNSGVYVGEAYNPGNTIDSPVVWYTPFGPTVLGSEGGNQSVASGINASGKIVGSSQPTGSSAYDAVLWDGIVPTVLGSLGGNNSQAYSINASGQVVGNSDTVLGGHTHGFLYNAGTMYDLNSIVQPGSGIADIVIDPLASPNSINDLGQIAAYGTSISNGETEALLLTPISGVPEPCTSGLAFAFALGAAALLSRAPRRRRGQVANATT